MAHKVCFIGCGRRAAEHMPAVLADKRCVVAGLADTNREAAEKFRDTYTLQAPVFGDHREMLARVKPDVIVTCLWTPLHLPVYRDCVEAGVKAVLSEKPMAPTWKECRDMAALAETSKCQLTFSHQRRFSSGNVQVRQWIEQGLFGEIKRMDLYSPKNLLDCGTHTFDQALSFNHETPAKWVLGTVDATETVKWFDVSAETLATGLVVFANGVRAYFQVGGPDSDMNSGVRVVGTKGFIETDWDGKFGQGVVYADPSWKPVQPADDKGWNMAAYVRDTLDCLESGRESVVSHRHALRASEIIFSLYESVRRNARLELPLTGVDDNPFITMLNAGEFERRRHGSPTAVTSSV